MLKIPQLETKRPILRAPTDGDAITYEKLYADNEASKFYGGLLCYIFLR